jgi:hypothetical protein
LRVTDAISCSYHILFLGHTFCKLLMAPSNAAVSSTVKMVLVRLKIRKKIS